MELLSVVGRPRERCICIERSVGFAQVQQRFIKWRALIFAKLNSVFVKERNAIQKWLFLPAVHKWHRVFQRLGIAQQTAREMAPGMVA